MEHPVEMQFEVVRAEDLPGILQYRLRLNEPACATWAAEVMEALAQRMPAQALGWWFRMRIALNGRAPTYLLPERWTAQE